jgi:hypothetical protein
MKVTIADLVRAAQKIGLGLGLTYIGPRSYFHPSILPVREVIT